MFSYLPRKMLVLWVALVGAIAAATPVHAQNEEFVSHWNGWADLDISVAGVINATGMQGGHIWTIDPPNTTTVRAYFALEVDSQVINSVSINEGEMINGPDTFSRDSNNPDAVPISWQYQLTPGWHRVVFTGWIYWDGAGWGAGSAVQDNRFYFDEWVFI
jgi:hypothetical protein